VSDEAHHLRQQVINRVLQGPGVSSPEARRAAFDNTGANSSTRDLTSKVVQNAWKVTGNDVAAAKATGASDDEIFELVIAAALGQSTRQLDAAMRQLDEVLPAATKEGQ